MPELAIALVDYDNVKTRDERNAGDVGINLADVGTLRQSIRESDFLKIGRIADAFRRKIEDVDGEIRAFLSDAGPGGRLDRARLAEFGVRREEILTEAVCELQRQLAPGTWHTVRRFVITEFRAGIRTVEMQQ